MQQWRNSIFFRGGPRTSSFKAREGDGGKAGTGEVEKGDEAWGWGGGRGWGGVGFGRGGETVGGEEGGGGRVEKRRG